MCKLSNFSPVVRSYKKYMGFFTPKNDRLSEIQTSLLLSEKTNIPSLKLSIFRELLMWPFINFILFAVCCSKIIHEVQCIHTVHSFYVTVVQNTNKYRSIRFIKALS